MARMFQGILGGLSGKIGNVVGSSWKGIPVLKTKPLSVANPRTAAQIAQRSKMEGVTFYGSKLNSAVIKPLWDRFAAKMSGYNAWIQANIGAFSSVNEYIPSQVVMSRGKMVATPTNGSTAVDGGDMLQVSFEDDLLDSYQQLTDIPVLAGICIAKGIVATPTGSQTRADSFAQARFEEELEAGDIVHYWLSFKRADGTVVSDSYYGSLTVEA